MSFWLGRSTLPDNLQLLNRQNTLRHLFGYYKYQIPASGSSLIALLCRIIMQTIFAPDVEGSMPVRHRGANNSRLFLTCSFRKVITGLIHHSHRDASPTRYQWQSHIAFFRFNWAINSSMVWRDKWFSPHNKVHQLCCHWTWWGLINCSRCSSHQSTAVFCLLSFSQIADSFSRSPAVLA